MLITHEWVSSVGGSENVFRELLAAFPDAKAGCLWNDMPGTFDRPVMESPLARSPMRGRKALALPMMPAVWANTELSSYETVLASSHAFGHHVAAKAAREGRRAFSYIHTPARYVWAPEVEVRGQGLAARLGSLPLKRIDRRVVDPRVQYTANSEYVRERIQRCWGVDATVIYPPVQVERIQSVERWRDGLSAAEEKLFMTLPQDGFLLGASRLVSYKRLDLVIQLGEELGMPVVIAGSGPDEAELKALAETVRVPVHFTGRVTDDQLYALYQEASLFVFLPVEDFGIMPVECMAAGTPVLVNRIGGARESVVSVGGGSEVPDTSNIAPIAEEALRVLTIDMRPAAVNRFGLTEFRQRIREWIA